MNRKKIKLFDLLAIFLLIGVIMLIFNILLMKSHFGRKGDSWAVVYVKLNNQPPWVDEAINIGDTELLGRKEIAKILEKKSIPTQAATDFEIHWMPSPVSGTNSKIIFDLPVYKNNLDITLKAKLLAEKGTRGNLEFRNQDIKVNEPIEIQTKNINIRGIIMSFERK